MSQIALEKALSTLGALSREELIMLRGIIDEVLAADFDGQADGRERAEARPGSPDGGQGHIELKMINGYGPYKYLRRWHKGSLTSTYLGKAAS